MIETKIFKSAWESEKAPKLAIHETTTPTIEARFAMSLIERWGLVAAKENGEDSVGRAKLKALTPAETVSKAVETAELAMIEFRKRGWIFDIPTLSEMEQFVRHTVSSEDD